MALKIGGIYDLGNLALAVGAWEHPLLEGCTPLMPYPIELVKQASWRTTAEKVELIKDSTRAPMWR